MNFEKIKQWIKNPYNLAFTLMLLATVYLRFRYLFQESVWVDETAYMLAGHDFAKWPIDMLIQRFKYLHFIPEIVIGIFNLFTTPFIAGRLMGLVYAILGITFTYLIGGEIKDKLTGLIAATLVAFNPYIWFHSSRALIDSPLATMFIICTYYLIRLIKHYSIRDIIILGIILLLTIFTKYVGGLFLFIIICFYLLDFIIFQKFKIKRLNINIKEILISLTGISILLFFIRKNIMWALQSLTYNNFFILQMPNMLNNYIILLSALGLIFTLIYKNRNYLIITLWALVLYSAFTFIPAGPYPRYILPAIPAVIILASIGFTESLEFTKLFFKIKEFDKVKIIATILLLILVIPSYYENANSMSLRLSYPYSGYDEAGEWIKEHVEKGSEVHVMSTSWAALFTGYDGFSTKSDKSITFYNTARKTKPEDMYYYLMDNNQKNIYLIIDQWESGAQPKWLTPSEENFNQITNMGFELQEIIFKKYPTTNDDLTKLYNSIKVTTFKIDDRSLPEIPAVFIFKYIKK